MTCIVGRVDYNKKYVVIGADSAASSDSKQVIRKDPKIFKVGEFLFGCTSSYRMIQLLRYSLKLPDIGDRDIYEYMCTDFINSIRECFKLGGYLSTVDGEENGGTFLVGYKNRLFKIEGDFQVEETLNGINACGCGEEYALGASIAIDNMGLTTEDKIIKALEASEYFALGVQRPFIIQNTLN